MSEGIIVVDKPDGMTSHDVVACARKKLKTRRVGHAGTLDPLATGVLILLVGKATKLFNKFVSFDKAYRATMILGTQTTTADTQGTVVKQLPYEHITREELEGVMQRFQGEIEQVPPMVSAVKHKGRKLYQLARKGLTVERKARNVRIDCLRLEKFELPRAQFYLECSKGTYVRQLAEDVGNVLGCGACIAQIRRTKVGSFHIDDAVNLEDLNESHLRSWESEKAI